MPEDDDEYLSDEQVQAAFRGGPTVSKAALVMLGGRIYKREDGRWRLLDNKCYRSVGEMSRGSA